MNKLAMPEQIRAVFAEYHLSADTPVIDCVGLTDRERDVLITIHCIPQDVSENSPWRREWWWQVDGYLHDDVIVLVSPEYRIDPDVLNGEEWLECVVTVEAIHDEFGWRRGRTWCDACIVQVVEGVLIASFKPFVDHGER